MQTSDWLCVLRVLVTIVPLVRLNPSPTYFYDSFYQGGVPHSSTPVQYLSVPGWTPYVPAPHVPTVYHNTLMTRHSHDAVSRTHQQSDVTDAPPAEVRSMEFTPSNVSARFFERQEVVRRAMDEIPRTDTDYMEDLLKNVFHTHRNDVVNLASKRFIREKIFRMFEEYGLYATTQNFTDNEPNELDNRVVIDGLNIIGFLRGKHWETMQDKILLVGAHYDTYLQSPGVNDNGSGMAVMMEIIRSLLRASCSLQYTIMFVAFDQEELGGLGSFYFVNDYLIPKILQAKRGTFQGAYIIDTILNYNNSQNSQDWPSDFKEVLPRLSEIVEATGNRGDFLSLMSRSPIDTPLAEQLLESWSEMEESQYKLYDMPTRLSAAIPSMAHLTAHMNFVRSDHAMFWYHNTSSYGTTLKAVLITDTGPFRGRMRRCYHASCDDVSFVAPENLKQVKKLGDSLLKTLLELGNGTCKDPLMARSSPIINKGSRYSPSLVSCIIIVALMFFFSS